MANIYQFTNKAFKNFYLVPLVAEGSAANSNPEHLAASEFIMAELDCERTDKCETEMEYAVSGALYMGFLEGVDWARRNK